MRITTHAVDNYLERVLKISEDNASGQMREFASEQIKKAVNDPEVIYQGEQGSCPIYIRNGCAVPVEDEDPLIIRTSYNAGTYLGKIENNEQTEWISS